MNYLFHLYLSEAEPEVQLGNMMGDFVKGRLEQHNYPERIMYGIRQHRQLDSFAGRSAAFQSSRLRIAGEFGYFRSIMVDVFYDHLLAKGWERYHDQSLEQFAVSIYSLLERHFEQLPTGLQQVAPRMISRNWLVSYREPEIIGKVLTRLDQRMSRPTPLASGLEQLHRHYDALEKDCEQFIEEARKFLQNSQ